MREIKIRTAHGSGVHGLALLQLDAQEVLVSGGGQFDSSVALWMPTATPNEPIYDLVQKCTVHECGVTALAAIGASRVCSTGRGGSCKVWQLTLGKCTPTADTIYHASDGVCHLQCIAVHSLLSS